MNFILLTNNDIDGVGQQAINLNARLKNKGHKSKIIVLHKNKENADVIKIKRSFFLRTLLYLLNFIKKDFFGLFNFGYSTVRYNDIKKYTDDADIVIIYSLYKMISNKILADILSSNKIVYFRPLDMELVTGGCHANIYNKDQICQKFKSDCKNCPQLNFLDIFNFSGNNMIEKNKVFKAFKPRILVPNTFAKTYFKKSKIFKNTKTETVFSSTDKNKIKFYSKKVARKLLNINKNEKVILFISFDLDSPHKGGDILKKSLKILVSKLNKKKVHNIRLLSLGRKNNFSFNIDGIKWTHLGLVSSIKKLNLLYRSADLLVCPSTYDTGPHCVTEALLNDLPIVAFDQGVAHDTIINGKNGYLVPCFNKMIFANSISKVLFTQKSKFKSNKAKSLFHPLNEVNKIIKIAKIDLKNDNRMSRL